MVMWSTQGYHYHEPITYDEELDRYELERASSYQCWQSSNKNDSRKCKMHNAQWGALRRKKKRSKFKQKWIVANAKCTMHNGEH